MCSRKAISAAVESAISATRQGTGTAFAPARFSSSSEIASPAAALNFFKAIGARLHQLLDWIDKLLARVLQSAGARGLDGIAERTCGALF
jgi:hypothetical protein